MLTDLPVPPAVRTGGALELRITRQALFLWLTAATVLLAAFGYDSLPVRVALFVALGVTAVAVVRADLAHPITWFVPVFGLYSLSAPLVYLVERPAGEWLVASQAVLCQLVALAAFVAAYRPAPGDADPQLRKTLAVDRVFARLSLWARPLFTVSFGLTIVFVTYVARTGFGSKQELVRDNVFAFKLQFAFSLLLLAWFALLIGRLLRHRRLPWLGWCAAALWFGVATFVSSERDLLLRFGLISVVLYHLFVRRIPASRVLLLGVMAVVLVGLLGVRKLQKKTGSAVISATSLVDHTLRGEFYSASDNLIVLLESFEAGTTDHLWGETYADDMVRVFASSSVFGDRDALQNGTAWFNRTFYASTYARGGGRGFSLVAEAFLNFGYWGVAFLFFGLSICLHWLFRRSGQVSVGLLYALVVPGVVYAIRMDFSALLSYGAKQVVVPVFCLVLLGALMQRAGLVRQSRFALPPSPAELS